MADPRRIVLLGAMAQMPFAGVAWQVLHYLEGLRRLGHEVFYVEDTGSWPYDPEAETVTDDATAAVRRLERLTTDAGFGERWAYRNAAREDEVWGISAERLDRVLAEADLLINLSGSTVLGESHLAIPCRIYLETDPVTPQLEIAEGRQSTVDFLAAHTHHFTFGERIGAADCGVPAGPFDYRPTRQPVILDWWPPPPEFPQPPAGPLRFTTVASWEQGQKDIAWNGETYTWSKSAEFEKLADVARRSGAEFAPALALDDPDTLAELEGWGWNVLHAGPISRDLDAYRSFITSSGAEFTAAKDQNVRLRSGWFSDRTATYLAAGRPAVVQDTGFDVAVPTGEGLLAFRTADEAVSAIEEVAANYPRHSRAARALAESHFRAEDVLTRLLAAAGA